MTQGYPVERPRSPLSRRLLILRVTTLATGGQTLGGCILRDGVAGGMFSGGGITDSDIGDASGHGHRQRPSPPAVNAEPKAAAR